jgi:mono/diheme cytochrome c family protein
MIRMVLARMAFPLLYAVAIVGGGSVSLGAAAGLPLILLAAEFIAVASPTQGDAVARRAAARATAIVYACVIALCVVRSSDGIATEQLWACGLGAGVFGLLAAHELIHSRTTFDRGIALMLLTLVGYRHFRISHIHGHHRHAATAWDPTTARRGEAVGAFLVRSILMQLVGVWRHEGGTRTLAANRLTGDVAAYAVLYGAIIALLGKSAALFLAGQSLIAVATLECFNYVAHYGLARTQNARGDIEPLGHRHCWNSRGSALANWLLFDMGNHGRHHGRGARVDAPNLLPGGYAGAILLALVPPLWKRIMDPRADALAMRTSTRRASVGAAGSALLLALSACATKLPPAPEPLDPRDPEAARRGAYLVAAANCIGCHTDKKAFGQPFAGGGAVATPFGVYYSRNITPDRTHGIGAWSDQAFLRALRQGIAPNGDYYFPAFPFPAFTGMTDRDILDIKAYLMTREPSAAANKKPDVPFPYNVRASMVLWRALYFKEGPLRPDPAKSAEWNRGNYLANAVSHCPECHTHRNKLGALDEKRRFAGGTLDAPGHRTVPNYATKAPNITPHLSDGIGAWSVADIVKLLATGARPNGTFVAAPMSEVVDGTAKLTDADRRAIAVYLKSLSPLAGRAG